MVKEFEFTGVPSEDGEYGCLSVRSPWENDGENKLSVISIWDDKSCYDDEPHVFEEGKEYKITVTIEEVSHANQ